MEEVNGMKIKASCKQDEKAAKALAYLEIYGKKKPRKRLITRTLLCAVLLLLLMLQIYFLGWIVANIVLLAVLALLIFLEYWWYFAAPKRRWKAMGKRQGKEKSYVFTDDAVTADQKLTVQYRDLLRAAETKEYLFLFREKKKVIMVDKKTVTGGTPEQLCKKIHSILQERYIICKH